MADGPIDAGGKGVVLKTPTLMGIYRTAVNNGYNLTAGQRKAIIREAFCILEDGESDKRERIAAAKVLLAADKLDMEAEKIALAREQGPREGDKHLHLNAPAEMFRELMNEISAHQHPAEADSEPAGDD